MQTGAAVRCTVHDCTCCTRGEETRKPETNVAAESRETESRARGAGARAATQGPSSLHGARALAHTLRRTHPGVVTYYGESDYLVYSVMPRT